MRKSMSETQEEWRFAEGTFTGDFLPKLMPHYGQGALDGACGFYCVAMILDYWEVCQPLQQLKVPKSPLRKYLESLNATTLLEEGLTTRKLSAVAKLFAPNEKLTAKSTHMEDFYGALAAVLDDVKQAIPGIISYEWEVPYSGETGAHYAVTVGYGKDSIFLMDPSSNSAKGSLYNNAIRSRRKDSVWCDDGSRIRKIRSYLKFQRPNFTAAPELWQPLQG